MMQIALPRSLSGIIACSAARHRELGGTGHGRQGKSAASGRAHMVGWVEYFRRFENWPCWRSAPNTPTISMPRAPSLLLRTASSAMTSRDDDLHIRPGRIRHGNQGAKRPKSFVGEVMRAAKKAGHVGESFGRGKAGASRSRFGRGRRAALSLSLHSTSRRVVTKARVVRHHGTRFRSAPLPKHIAYLKREGVTRDGADARMFDANSEVADERAFAERCEDDRHHFRFIVSPEDAAELETCAASRAS